MDLMLIGFLISFVGVFHIAQSRGLDSCQYICSVKDDVSTGVWERVSAHASDAADLESLAGYTNHSFEHLGNWAAHFCARRQVDYVRAHESFMWRWNPHTCRLFDPRPVGLHSDSVTTLLHKLGNAKIVFVGDSIVTEQYFSLEALLGAHITEAKLEHVRIDGKAHHVPFIGFKTGTGLQVQYTRSDLLVDTDTLLVDEVASTSQEGGRTIYNYSLNATRLGCCSSPWAHLMGGVTTHLVLATSPHWGRGRGKPVAVYKVMIQNLLGYLQRNFRGVRVYIRAAASGHPNCKHAQGPYSDTLYEHDPVWHNWAEFDSHNRAWKEALAALCDDRFVFLDVEPMTRTRPDGHLNPPSPDCLHYCLPGVIDYWTLLLASFWMSCKR